jgi:hypothetical protein
MDAQVTDLPNKRPRGRQPGSHVAPGLRRTSSLRPRDLVPIDRTSGAGRFFAKMVREIEVDLGAGSRRNLSRIESELIRAFAGAATQLQYLNHQILLGEGSEIDLVGFSQLASTMLRIGSRLGTTRRAKSVIDLDTFLAMRKSAKAPEAPREGEVIE